MISEIVGFVANDVHSRIGSKFIDKAIEITDVKFRDPKLIDSVKDIIRKKYGEYGFYNGFDRFLCEYNIIPKLIEMFYCISSEGAISKARFVETCLNKFCETIECSPYEVTLAGDGLGIIYDEVYAKLIVLNAHTDLGKLQTSGAIWADQSKLEHQKLYDISYEVLGCVKAIAQMGGSIQAGEVINAENGPISARITSFMNRVNSVEKENTNDHDLIQKYKDLLADIPFELMGEPKKHIDSIICSIECHIALRYSNMCDIDKASECLNRVPDSAKNECKLYYFVRALVIINGSISEKYAEAKGYINKALQIDSTYHQAYLIGEYLSALQHESELSNLIKSVNDHFEPIISENKEKELIIEFYLYRGFIYREYGEYESAEKDILCAKNQGYDLLSSDFDLASLYYCWATADYSKNQRLFLKKLNIPLFLKVKTILAVWLLNTTAQIPVHIKSRMVSLYSSTCGLLGLKHGLAPLESYVNLPGLTYEEIRTIVLGYSGNIPDEIIQMLSDDDSLYISIANCMNSGDMNGASDIISNLSDEKITSLPIPTIFLALQIGLICKNYSLYDRYRSFVSETDELGVIDCLDAYALEIKGDVEKAKTIIDRFANSSDDYHLLSNNINFYARNGYDHERKILYLRILSLYDNNSICIDDKLDFFAEAITFFIKAQSNLAKEFMDRVNEDCEKAWRLKAYYYEAIDDATNLIYALSELERYDNGLKVKYNKCVSLLKLLRYSEAYNEATELLSSVSDNSEEQVQVFILLSNICLMNNKTEDSYEWAKKVHEKAINQPGHAGHQFYMSRATRTGHIDEALLRIIEYKNTHPVVTGKWIKEVKASEEGSSGEDFLKALDDVVGESHLEYAKREKEFSALYRKNPQCPNALVLKYYNNQLLSFFSFASKNKIFISNGNRQDVFEKERLVGDDVVVDALTLIVLSQHDCLTALDKIKNVHLPFATIERIQEWNLDTNYLFTDKLLDWISNASNIVLEANGFIPASTLANIFEKEYLFCCALSKQISAPLLTVEVSVDLLGNLKDDPIISEVKTLGIVTLCYSTMKDNQKELNGMLYRLLEDCTFINFTASTMLDQIEKDGHIIQKENLSRFLVCNSSCDMLSFAQVYYQTFTELCKTSQSVADDFASLILDDAYKIWRRGTHYRIMSENYSDAEAIARVKAINQYMIVIVNLFKSSYQCIPESIDMKCRIIMNNVTEELKQDFAKKSLSLFSKIPPYLSNK